MYKFTQVKLSERSKLDFATLPAQKLLAGNVCIVLLYLHLKEIPAQCGVWRRKLKKIYNNYILTLKIILKRDPVSYNFVDFFCVEMEP